MHSRSSRSLVRLGEYELVRRIATGGMAEVYEARRPGPRGFAKRVALKRILPQLAMDQRLVRMFCAEARVHAALTHPNLVSVLDFGEAAGELFLVLEYVDGVPLSDVLRAVAARKRAIELGPALHIAREVAAGLAYAHQYRDDDDAPLGVVHRDVAPNNILLGRAGEVKLTDFGIVHSAWSEVRTAPGELRGKVGYVSPEQAQGGAIEARTDLFSLGVVLAEMLLGAPLIPGNSELEILKNLQGRSWESLPGLVGKVPADVLALLQRLLAKSPRNRPASAQLVAEELDKLATAHAVRTSAHALSLWLADLGVVRIESNIRVTPSRDDAPYAAPAPSTSAPRAEQDTIVDDDALKPIVISLPAPNLPEDLPTLNRPVASGTPTLRYRLRRPGGEVIGPLSLASVLAMLATARAGLDSELAREDAPFLKLSRAFELTRLAARPLYRFFDPIALLATERHPVERGSLAAHLLRLAASGRTGLLVYRHGAEQRRIYFENGVPAAMSSTEPSELLGTQLVRAGLVSEADMERVLESGYRSGCSLGESLVRANLISSERLSQSLTEQRVRRLTAVCRARAGELFFVEEARSGEAPPSPSQKPLGLLIEALRAAYPEEELLGLLGGLERTSLGPSPACAALRSALCLSSDEAYAFDLCLRGVKLGLVLREARGRGQGALRAALFASFVGLSAGAFAVRPD
ncbi:MAG TPA: protein kinase [Polyangiaceae bacterium]|nr:protein kinase [Polyangiaceae bacterium]